MCLGPGRAGFSHCLQCGRHAAVGGGLLADLVVPVSYAVRGTVLAGYLWRYKSGMRDPAAGAALGALLLVFLRDHGACLSQPGHAVTVPGDRRAVLPPDLLAVVPSGYGRPGAHPLVRLVAPYLRLPLAGLTLRPGEQGRDLNAARFAARGRVSGARVLLLDDTWVSGASVQSAAMCLKLAGAASVTAVVLGRYLNPALPGHAAFAAGLGETAYDPAKCAICARNDNYSRT